MKSLFDDEPEETAVASLDAEFAEAAPVDRSGLWRTNPGVVRAELVQGEELLALAGFTSAYRRIKGAEIADSIFCPNGHWDADVASCYINITLTGIDSLKPDVTIERAREALELFEAIAQADAIAKVGGPTR